MRMLVVLTALAVSAILQLFVPGLAASAENKLHTYFGARVSSRQSVESVAKSIMRRFPPGTSRKVIEANLTRTGAKNDKQLYFNNDERGINCRIGYDSRSFGFVKTSYDLTFSFDPQEKLIDVRVSRHLTGL